MQESINIIKAGLMRKFAVAKNTIEFDAKIRLNLIISFAIVDNYRPVTINNNIKTHVHSYTVTYSDKDR
jgi:hypothetical protein